MPSGEELTSSAQDPTASERGPLSSAIVRVVDAQGKPIPDALGTLSRPTRDWIRASGCWPDLGWGELAAFTTEFRSDEDGRLVLPLPVGPSGDVREVLWVTHPGYSSGELVWVRGGDGALRGSLVLSTAPAVCVRVVDAVGNPVPEAVVHEIPDLVDRDFRSAETLWESLSAAKGEAPLAAMLLLRRSARADLKGEAWLPWMKGGARVQAEAGELRSSMLALKGSSAVTLRLCPTFKLQGSTRFDEGAALTGKARVRCMVTNWMGGELLDQLAVRLDGTFGPALLCIDPEFIRYYFRLDGGAVTAEMIELPPPRSGELVNLEFHARKSFGIAVHVANKDGQALSSAPTRIQWTDEGVWQDRRRLTGEDGIAFFEDAPRNKVFVRAECPGYGSFVSRELDAPADFASTYQVTLEPAGTIRGRCINGEQHSVDFRVFYWLEGQPGRDYVDVRNSSDGSFEITSAPPGNVTLMAMSAESPHSSAKTVVVTSGGVAETVLEFTDAMAGHGIVVDASTMQPMPGAQVQPSVMYGDAIVSNWKRPLVTDSGGRFAGIVFGEGLNTLDFTAPGFAKRRIQMFGKRGEDTDVGTIALWHCVSLEVQLVDPGVREWRDCTLALAGTSTVEEQPFPADGLAVFPALEPGVYFLRVALGDGSFVFQTLTLAPDRPLHVDIPAGNRHLSVEVAQSATQALPEDLVLQVYFHDAAGQGILQAYVVSKSREVTVRRFDSEKVVLELQDGQGRLLALERFDFRGGIPGRVRLNVAAHDIRIEVVDVDLKPIPKARLICRIMDDPTHWGADLEADADGICTLRGAFGKDLSVTVFAAGHGLLPAQRISVSPDSETKVRIVVDAKLHLRVRTLEDGKPAGGIGVWAHDAGGVEMASQLTVTAADGTGGWRPVGAGAYTISIDQAGYWPSRSSVSLNADSGTFDIPLRGLGGLRFVAQNAFGNPVPNAHVELVSRMDGCGVDSWIESGRVPSPSGGGDTDAQGTVEFSGLPSGEYHWKATSVDGDVAEGELHLVARSTTEIPVRLE